MKCDHKYFANMGMRSHRELIIEEYLKSLGYEPFHDSRYGFEIDIAVKTPDNRVIGFEFNGVRFHCTATARRTRGITLKSMSYHHDKTLNALRRGVLLYHFWDFEDIATVKTQIWHILRGDTVSTTNADKNPSLILHAQLVPKYVYAERTTFCKEMVPYDNKPLNWKNLQVQCYEIYNAGYVL